MEIPSVRQLQCLVAVAETCNFRRAAERCFITQPAVSSQIRQLESLLGVTLFERDKRRVAPTPAGLALADRARSILGELAEFVDAAPAFRQPLSGRLALGVIPTVAPYVLPAALTTVRAKYPALELLLEERQTARLVEAVNQGRLDAALLAMEADLGDLETMPLYRDPFLLAVPEGHPLGKRSVVDEKHLEGESVLLLEDGHCLREQALAVCDHADACEIGDFRATSLGTLVQMVVGGMGVTLLPSMAARVEAGPDRHLALVPFLPPTPGRTIGLAWRRSSLRKDELRSLAKALRPDPPSTT